MFNILELDRLVYPLLSRHSLVQCARVNSAWNKGTLKKLKVRIADVPKVEGAPTAQKKVFERLVRLENLEVLWLGHQPQIRIAQATLPPRLHYKLPYSFRGTAGYDFDRSEANGRDDHDNRWRQAPEQLQRPPAVARIVLRD
ncbi:hypothetical protein BGZ81_010818 [Podila clonocystis]|nr:hypothetical protein BGZ81_010818 [Podila clonocystis]